MLYPPIATITPVVDGVPIFETRSDFDTAIVGVALALALHRVVSGERKYWMVDVAIVGSAIAILVVSESRAGTLGAAVAVLVALRHAVKRRRSLRKRNELMMFGLAAVIVGLIIVQPSTAATARLAGVIPGIQTSSQSQALAASGRGTADARERTWSYLVEYGTSSTSKTAFGVGFGPDFMTETPAGRLLVGGGYQLDSGETATRSPHNYWLGSFIRLGIIGLALLTLMVAVVLSFAWRTGGLGKDEGDLGLIAALVAVSLVIPASLGVVLESPFGSVPFWWAAGVLACRAREARANYRMEDFRG
ncbi:O-antigen ligase [Nocardioides sp.]|uniref:O-antigen ligase family protein n=1 Tax=Nocardioides sp. TaxID=35761 RepID=UPI002716EF5A|nr:O-antigen ligase family protein [Nocardioides sp.]MDO9454948.1 O-antigen ligase family protein [Nocardioides sp.]